MKVQKVLASLLVVFCLWGCGNSTEDSKKTTTAKTTSSSNSKITYDENDLDEDYSDEEAQKITMSMKGISFDGNGATVSEHTITISEAGTYIISGTSKDANIIVDSDKDAFVRIVLDNANITSTSTAVIYIKQADKVVLTLAKGSNNTINDASNYSTIVDNEPNAAIFAKDDLTINGSGVLNVNASYNNGIQSKDDLKIVNGTVQVTASNHGIVGKDLLGILYGTITISAQGDGIKTTNAEDSTKGIFAMEDGNLTIDAKQDGIQSENSLYIYGGSITITAGNGSTNGTKIRNDMGFNPFEESSTDTTTESMKGIKATSDLYIEGGTLSIDSADDCIHSNASIFLKNGTFSLKSGDDGIHSDTTLDISGGTMTIEESYEGLEGSTINIHGGSIHVNASDDGINASSSDDATALLAIRGGYLYVNALGDGLDSNGNIAMSDGTVIINGTQSGGDGALDYDGTFEISGGTLITSGSSQMLQYPSSVSNGNMVVVSFDDNLSDMLSIQENDGNTILTYQPTTAYQVLVFYSPQLQIGSTYRILTGGSASNATDGVYDNDTYLDGSTYQTFTISDTTTTIGNVTSAMHGGAPMDGKGGGFR